MREVEVLPVKQKESRIVFVRYAVMMHRCLLCQMQLVRGQVALKWRWVNGQWSTWFGWYWSKNLFIGERFGQVYHHLKQLLREDHRWHALCWRNWEGCLPGAVFVFVFVYYKLYLYQVFTEHWPNVVPYIHCKLFIDKNMFLTTPAEEKNNELHGSWISAMYTSPQLGQQHQLPTTQ